MPIRLEEVMVRLESRRTCSAREKISMGDRQGEVECGKGRARGEGEAQ